MSRTGPLVRPTMGLLPAARAMEGQGIVGHRAMVGRCLLHAVTDRSVHLHTEEPRLLALGLRHHHPAGSAAQRLPCPIRASEPEFKTIVCIRGLLSSMLLLKRLIGHGGDDMFKRELEGVLPSVQLILLEQFGVAA